MSQTPLTFAQPADVLAFWREAGPTRWFRKDTAFDDEFRDRFLGAHEAAARGDLDAWAGDAEGALALVILLDQFPRNAFRGTDRMFQTDERAREVTLRALAAGYDLQVEPELRNFFLLPLQHSERLEDQDLCVQHAEKLGGEAARYAAHHRDIIARFGRFPHRNALLGRTTMPDEQKFLDEGGFAG
jgi:uncharacterized protein (DUF924 family)